MQIFYFFLTVRSADQDILCRGSLSHHVKVYSFMFMHKISTQVVCVNGMHTSGVLFFPSPVAESCTVTRDTGRSGTLGMSCLRTKTPYHLIFVYVFSLSRLAITISFCFSFLVFKNISCLGNFPM